MDDTDACGRKSTQRERLLAGMRTAVIEEGYAQTTIAKVIKAARVSRPTFYEYFDDKEDCFVAVLDEVARLTVEEVQAAAAGATPQRAAGAAVSRLVELAGRDPAVAGLVVRESLGCGTRGLDIRDRAIGEIARSVEGRYGSLGPASRVPDVSVGVLLGAVQRMLASRLRRDEGVSEGLERELLAWIKSYEARLSGHRWRTLEPVTLPASTVLLAPLLAPPALGPGRPRLPKEQVAEIHRQRILFAAAEVSERKGYAATTIREITSLAGVDGRVLHSLFADKNELFIAVHEMHFQRLMAVTASAFFTVQSWPDRVWEAGRAFAGCVEESSTLARVSFVESYAGGPIALERVEEVVGAFQIFLQEGYQYADPDPAPSPLALEAITATIFEIVYRQTRASAKPDISGLLGHVTHLALAPFLGPAETNTFIAEKLGEARKSMAQ